MLGNFLDKATGLLDKRFIIAYWFPVFITSIILLLIRIYIYGFAAGLKWWQQDWMLSGHETGSYAQLWILVGSLVLITIIAYLLQPLTRSIIRLYEGYWPLKLGELFTNLPVLGEKSILKTKNEQLSLAESNGEIEKSNRLRNQIFYNYPKEYRIMPTRLGNTLRAAEDYSNTAYGMDSVLWLPRLWPLIPDVMKNEVEDSLIPMVALLNFTSLIVVVAISGSIYLKYVGSTMQAYFELLIGLIVAWIFYRAAVVQAQSYGINIRVTIDLYRFDLLKAVHQSLPETPKEEKLVWEILKFWLYINNPSAADNIEYNHDNGSNKSSGDKERIVELKEQIAVKDTQIAKLTETMNTQTGNIQSLINQKGEP